MPKPKAKTPRISDTGLHCVYKANKRRGYWHPAFGYYAKVKADGKERYLGWGLDLREVAKLVDDYHQSVGDTSRERNLDILDRLELPQPQPDGKDPTPPRRKIKRTPRPPKPKPPPPEEKEVYEGYVL